jgi:hypothetical protein
LASTKGGRLSGPGSTPSFFNIVGRNDTPFKSQFLY